MRIYDPCPHCGESHWIDVGANALCGCCLSYFDSDGVFHAELREPPSESAPNYKAENTALKRELDNLSRRCDELKKRLDKGAEATAAVTEENRYLAVQNANLSGQIEAFRFCISSGRFKTGGETP